MQQTRSYKVFRALRNLMFIIHNGEWGWFFRFCFSWLVYDTLVLVKPHLHFQAFVKYLSQGHSFLNSDGSLSNV